MFSQVMVQWNGYKVNFYAILLKGNYIDNDKVDDGDDDDESNNVHGNSNNNNNTNYINFTTTCKPNNCKVCLGEHLT